MLSSSFPSPKHAVVGLMDALRRNGVQSSKLKSLLTRLHLRAPLFSSDPLFQNDSLLLGTLPLEVRRQIYAEVLDSYGTVQRITLTHGKLTHMSCFNPESHEYFQDRVLHFEDRRYGMRVCNSYKEADRERSRDGSEIMPLLLSCRRIYSEVIDLLYTGLTLRLSVEAARRLISIVPNPHLAFTNIQLVFCVSLPMYLPSDRWPLGLALEEDDAIRQKVRTKEGEWEAFGRSFSKMTVNSLVMEF
ncbi:hypothetical protein DL98DRAFT_516550 [Cadophora sp. DSE1049]|nr:hypothetical protein DL98DRAFT_516550 [Cadophora sp. DSE1049]